MAKAMSPADWTARGEAYYEAAQHLFLAWTDDARERDQGNIVANKLLAESDKCHRIAGSAVIEQSEKIDGTIVRTVRQADGSEAVRERIPGPESRTNPRTAPWTMAKALNPNAD